jgi:hypothetical protein
MGAKQKFSFIAVAVGLFFIGGIIWWSIRWTAHWFPPVFRDEQAEVPEKPTIQEALLSGRANGGNAKISAEEKEAIVKQLISSSSAASLNQQEIINALAPKQ